MSVVRACPVVMSGAVRRVLTRRARGQKTPHRDKIRAQIVLLAAGRWSNAAIAVEVGVTVDTVRTWRGRFAAEGLAGLADRVRSGRPARFSPVQVAQVKALACQLPARVGVPLSRWSCPELAREAVVQGVVEVMSASTVWRWLMREAIKPWQYRSWLFPRDPDFAAKAERVLDLYKRRWQGRKLCPREYVISSDEKTSIQARCRCHPSLAPGCRRSRVSRSLRSRDSPPTHPVAPVSPATEGRSLSACSAPGTRASQRADGSAEPRTWRRQRGTAAHVWRASVGSRRNAACFRSPQPGKDSAAGRDLPDV
jgi:transposase